MTEELKPEERQRILAALEMAGIMGELMTSDAMREGRLPDRGDFVRVAMDLVIAAYSVAKLGGLEGVRDYARLVRSHAETAEQSVAGS